MKLQSSVRIWGVLLWVTCLLTALSASESRIRAMGKTGLYTYDPINIRYFPGDLFRYPNLLVADFQLESDTSNYIAGIHLPLGNSAVCALYLNSSFELPAFVQSFSDYHQLRGSELYLNMPLGSSRLGLRFAGAWEHSTRSGKGIPPTIIKESARYFEIGGGISGRAFDMSGYVSLPMLKSNGKGSNATWQGTGYGVYSRLFLGPIGGIYYIPVITASRIPAQLTTEGSTVTTDTDYRTFSLSMGIHYLVNNRNLIILGLEIYGFEKTQTTNVTTSKNVNRETRLPAFYLGGETRVSKWLYLRVGATQNFQRIKTTLLSITQSDQQTVTHRTRFELFLGAGIRVGGFLLDLEINDQSLLEGPGIIGRQSGDTSESFLSRMSITYAFGRNP